jgi:SAM-dependent methyltransferase
MRREQRLVFGEVAELYDRYRPAYPDAVIDDLIDLAELEPGSRVLEVGAGTGKATAMFAERGIRVLAVEPSAEMAGVARRMFGDRREVQIEQADFERWDPAGREFPLLFAAQAWHWVEPDVGFAKAARVLARGGLLAAFWNRPVWARAEIREVVLDVYDRVAPELLAETDPIHPGGTLPSDQNDWVRGVAATSGLSSAEVRDYEWSQTYSGGDYGALLETHSTIRVLDPHRRDALVAAVVDAIERHGDELRLPMVTRVCLARAAA